MDKYDCDVNDKQHSELLWIVSNLNDSKAVQQLIAEGDRILGEEQNALRQSWQQDGTERLEFEKDQTKAGVCVCVCVCVYLNNNTNLQLPLTEETDGAS